MESALFGIVFAACRKASGLAQSVVALRAGTTQRHLSFLETGRSMPSREMIMRLSIALDLSSDQRTQLFQAAGFTSPYKSRELSDVEIQSALLTVERQILANWPFPGFALTSDWTILLTNNAGASLLGTTAREVKNNPVSFFDLIFSDEFRNRILNWEEVQTLFFARLHLHAQNNPEFKHVLDAALEAGILKPNFQGLTRQSSLPAILPMKIQNADGTKFEMTSISAHFTSANDDIISDIEIELMVPLVG